jgi:hypothetical protein
MAREAGIDWTDFETDNGFNTLKALVALVRADERALAAPVQFVAWLVEFENGEQELHFDKQSVGETNTPLYTTPPAAQRQWVGLTKQERNAIEDYCEMIVGKPVFEAIEAKLKELNT